MTSPNTASQAHILVVDDNEINVQIAAALLSDFGLNVSTADSGQQCLDLVQSGHHYDIIFMDYLMPELNGAETLQHLRAAEPPQSHQIVIALSGEDDADARQTFLAMGFDDYIRKPISQQVAADILSIYLPNGAYSQTDNTVQNDDDNSQSDIPKNVTLPLIDGMQPLKAIAECGGFANWQQAVRTFFHYIPVKSDIIAEYLQNDDVSNYTIEVHALKTAANIIGCYSLSALCAEAERLGKQQQSEPTKQRQQSIITLTETLLSKYRSLLPLLSETASYTPYIKQQATMTAEQAEQLLDRIRQAADGHDLAALDDLAVTLRSSVLPTSIPIEELLCAIEEIDFDRIMEII